MPNQAKPIGVAILGFGFMGQKHHAAYAAAHVAGFPCNVIAISDSNAKRLQQGHSASSGNIHSETVAPDELPIIDPEVTTCYTSADELLADAAVNAVSICTHTDSHVELCMKALQAGKHVLIEKPVATTAVEVATLQEVAGQYPDQILMPAMCIRYWPGWSWLIDRARDHSLGAIRSLTIRRLGAQPGWAQDFYLDADRSGGAMVDLHIHDVDFIRHLLGQPISVKSIGDVSHVMTQYAFEDQGNSPMIVNAEGGWIADDSFPFQMQFLAQFEHAVADYDSRRETDPLRLHQNGAIQTVTLEEGAGYDFEIRAFIDAVTAADAGNDQPRRLLPMIDQAYAVMEIIEAERKSLRSGQVELV